MIQEFSFKGTPYVVFEQPTEVPDEIIKKEIECLFFDNFDLIDKGYYFCCLSENFDNTTNDSYDDYPFENAEHGYFRYCAIPKETYNKIIRGNFSSNENKSITIWKKLIWVRLSA